MLVCSGAVTSRVEESEVILVAVTGFESWTLHYHHTHQFFSYVLLLGAVLSFSVVNQLSTIAFTLMHCTIMTRN
jgi:hypothetical protein